MEGVEFCDEATATKGARERLPVFPAKKENEAMKGGARARGLWLLPRGETGGEEGSELAGF